ncbi:unnamed protein product [Adineta steineri]|uniref:LysM domain-containing protein n=1 Tax=Adineta steineri TaxID=433720 RepID=A0A813XN64_9BILA|nr:unnamed protein product [Adineta steineri]CAF0869329.1 unnamed protein product [Adineta steineri]
MNVNLVPDRSILLQALPLDSIRDTRRSRTVCQPKGTIMYTVDENDTLEKVALRFDSTPSELLQLNKLNARMLFPGQTLYVPENCSSDETTDLQESTTTISSSPPVSTLSSISSKRNKDSEAFILVTDRRHSNTSTPSPRSSLYSETQYDVGPMVWSMSKQSAARPGRVHRLISNPSTENESSSKTSEEDLKTQNVGNNEQVNLIQDFLPVAEHHQLDDECLQRFIKVTVRLMTEDHQSIAGTLLVTPNAVMFDPDVLDPLVKEHGIDKYGLIIRMNLLAGIALYDDLAIYEHKATSRDEEKRKMCHSTSVKHAHYCSTNKTLNSDEEEIQQLMSSLLDQIDKEFNPSASDDTCCMLFNAATSTIQRHLSKDSTENSYNDDDDDDDDDPTYLPTEIIDNSLQYSNDLFQALDDYKHSIGILSDDKNVNKNFNRVPSQISYGFDWKRFRRAVKIKKGCHLENCVPVDEFNKRFGEIDKLLHQQQQILCAPRPIEIPYYLCIKTSEPACEKPSLYARQYRKDTEKLIDNAYGKKQLEQEYWFLIPKEKIDELYVFFLRWTPEHESNPLTDEDQQPPNLEQLKQNDKSGNKGFVLLANDDPELNDNNSKSKNQKKSPKQKKPHYLSRQNTLLREWEVR